MTDHLNYFEPYLRREAHHEDQLTRAFLIILRHVPMAHAAWLALVDQGHRSNDGTGVPHLHELPEPDFYTQVRDLPDEVVRLVSVIQTDEHYFDEKDAAPSDRDQVLDGVVSYKPDLAVVMENKPSVKNIWNGQLRVNIPEGVEHDPRIACVRWRDVMSAFTNLLTNGLVRGSEQLLMEDFLGFVERNFPQLQPFTQLGVCGGDVARLERRCRAILEEVAPGMVYHHRGWGWYIRLNQGQPASMAALLVRKDEAGKVQVFLELDPGDTMRQARSFYDKVDIDDVLKLTEEGWAIRPNFHLAFMSSNLVWTKGTIQLEPYMRRWLDEPGSIVQVKREQFESYFGELIEAGIAGEADLSEFARHFTKTTRKTMNVCPGITMRKIWDLEEAVDLDARGELPGLVRQHVERALALWGDQLSVPEGK